MVASLFLAEKIIFRNRPGLKTAHWEVLRNEVRALEECAHPNIVTMMVWPPLNCHRLGTRAVMSAALYKYLLCIIPRHKPLAGS
jgi:hypothetical protein